ncbi:MULTISPECIES: hypothetical protein [unclassified Methylobacterium]|uniref:hypothetical protein n=1 Tax=unclassified Methylobacterium TaxID=2615210 RepID=UPI000371F70D|nr:MULTISPECIES: hypothetical protein [unclassified Methylobacterium]KQP41162.1 hypothetical protein ASF34_21805 [Methylobacterium sp. Leaf106]
MAWAGGLLRGALAEQGEHAAEGIDHASGREAYLSGIASKGQRMHISDELGNFYGRVSQALVLFSAVRIIREEAKRQSALLAAIERESAIEDRKHGSDAHT